MQKININKARELLKSIFPFTEMKKEHIAAFKTKKGRELVLELNRKEAFYLWMEKFDVSLGGVSIKNQDYPGLPYERKQPRNSNLNDTNAPRLKKGNKVWYLEIESMEALKK